MLRLLLLALIAANLAFFGFARGWLDGAFGLRASGDREPERIAAQVRPETIVVQSMPTASAASASACLEAGPIAAADSAAAEAALRAALPAGGWVAVRSDGATGDGAAASQTYRVAEADPATAARLVALRLDASGRGFSPCVMSEPAR